MSPLLIVAVLGSLTVFSYYLGRGRAVATAGGRPRALHSRPNYYGLYAALWCGVPAFAILAI